MLALITKGELVVKVEWPQKVKGMNNMNTHNASTFHLRKSLNIATANVKHHISPPYTRHGRACDTLNPSNYTLYNWTAVYK